MNDPRGTPFFMPGVTGRHPFDSYDDALYHDLMEDHLLEVVYNLWCDPDPTPPLPLICLDETTNPGYRRGGPGPRRKASEREIEALNSRRRLARASRKANRR